MIKMGFNGSFRSQIWPFTEIIAYKCWPNMNIVRSPDALGSGPQTGLAMAKRPKRGY